MALEMTLKLNAPGMTSLHKAGLAGLYMTLKAFDKNDEEIEGLKWRLEDKQIILHWTDDTPKEAFENLVKKSFWIDDEGFYSFAGLPIDSSDIERKYILYKALNSCFFTHKPSFPKGNPVTKIYRIGDMDDNKIRRIPNFSPILVAKPYRDIVKKFMDSKGNFKDEIEVKGWLYPGGVERHSGLSGTVWKESAKMALILLYAPVGVIFYELKSRNTEIQKKARWASVIPEITSLEFYATVRESIAHQGVLSLTANSSSDAVLRFFLAVATNQNLREMKHLSKLLKSRNEISNPQEKNENKFRCRVITHGEVKWDAQNNVRTGMQIVSYDKLQGLDNYYLADSIFGNSWQRTTQKSDIENEEEFFINIYSIRELIAENTTHNKPWYYRLSQYLSDKKVRTQIIRYEREKIGTMVEKANFDENKQFFISVCHKSWEMRLGKLGQRSRDENLGDKDRSDKEFKRLVKNESEKLRTSLLRCKTPAMLREKVIDFWTRAGTNKLLQNEGFNKILPFFSEENWRETKDLALLALISYQSTDKRVEEAIQDDSNSNTEGENE